MTDKNFGAILVLGGFVAKNKLVKPLLANDDMMVDIPLAELDAVFASNLPIHASVNLAIEFYFETSNRKLFEINHSITTQHNSS